ncbi:MAG: choice-of-anchor L domain-containing protein, partial [Bacteroidota bacterium]
VLMGFGVTASNITINGNPALANAVQTNVSYFNAAGTTFPINSGVLLTTGVGTVAAGPNNGGGVSLPGTPSVSTDPHLNDIAAGSVTNGVVLEFDFVPAGDTISFKYIFGSEEYPEFSPSTFNDAFGFFLWGPGISGPYALGGFPAGGANLAVIPGTSTPVTINNVGDANNTQYYVFNDNGSTYGTAIQYDGTTVLLTANASVQCGETYHIKLAICNVGDQGWDSGVFLEANSFSSEAVQIAVATVSGDTTVYEGCSDANFLFIRPETQLADTMIINYTVEGTATEGLDFNLLQNPITFLPGVDTVILNLTPTLDGIPDNAEYVTLTATTISECGDTIVSQGTLYIMDSIPFNITETDPLVLCADDSVLVTASATALFGPCTITWPDGSTGGSAYLPSVQGALTGSVDYVITATNTCGYSATDTVTITLNQTLAVDTLLSFPADCTPIGAVSAVITGATGVPNYNWTGPGPNSPNSWDASVWQNLSSGWYYFEVTDDVCEANDSVFVDILPPPVAQFQANPNDGCSPLQVLLTNNSQNASTFEWDFGNGNQVTLNNLNPQTQTYTENSIIRLIAIEGNCADTAYVPVTISICGCTNPLAVNYNPLANYDDGSCLFPAPTVYVPNVFTPNNDNSNDLFFLTTTNTTRIELTILNRWGNVVYENSGPNPAWDGKVESGAFAEDGVYFVKYRVEGLPGTDGSVQFLEGHGFLHLVRQ